MYRRIKGKICFASVLLSAFTLAACGGGGGGGVVAVERIFSFRDIVVLSAESELASSENLAAAAQSLAASSVKSPSDGLVFTSSDAEITTVVIDKTLEAGIWDFTFASETGSSTVNMTVALQPSEEPFNVEILGTSGTAGFDGGVFLLGGLIPTSTDDWLYAGAWLYAPEDPDNPDVPDDVTMVFFAGSDFPFAATDLADLTGTARYGSLGSPTDTEDGYMPEAFGVYTGPDGVSRLFTADALLEADFSMGMTISGAIVNADLTLRLNLEEATIGGKAGGFFAGTTEGAGGPIAGWDGEYGGKFHGVLPDTAPMKYPRGVSGTFGAIHPTDTGQSISGFFLSGFNDCTFHGVAGISSDDLVVCPSL